MSVAEVINVRELLVEGSAFGPEELAQIEKAIAGSECSDVIRQMSEIQNKVDSGMASPRDQLALGLTSYLLARHADADKYLSQVSGDALGAFHHGQTLVALERSGEAEEKFEQAAQLGFDQVQCALASAGAMRLDGRVDEAEEVLRGSAREAATRAEYSY